jgi:uncharacterized membrane protein YebE (DUF533 family)
MKKALMVSLVGLLVVGGAQAQTSEEAKLIRSGAVGAATGVLFFTRMASTTVLASTGVGLAAAAGVYTIYKLFDNDAVAAPAPAPAKKVKK